MKITGTSLAKPSDKDNYKVAQTLKILMSYVKKNDIKTSLGRLIKYNIKKYFESTVFVKSLK